MGQMVDKQRLNKVLDYFESQYNSSKSAFDRGAQYVCLRIRTEIESGRLDMAKEDNK